MTNHFSLDIEGGEFQVLKTIPWDKVCCIYLYESLGCCGT